MLNFRKAGFFSLPEILTTFALLSTRSPSASGAQCAGGAAISSFNHIMQLNFKQIGETGKPLIILHGVFGFLDNWLTIGKTLSEQGYRVYLVDQRNHGRSPHVPPLNFPTLAADLKEFLEQQHIESPVLIGHSMGGKTVMEYAVTYPDTFDALVVVMTKELTPRGTVTVVSWVPAVPLQLTVASTAPPLAAIVNEP